MENKNSPKDSKSLIGSVAIDKELSASFLDYAMSVIISRALPDVRDGLKPVHRRILYAMHNLGLYREKTYRKSANVIGEVIAKLHPHGNDPIYQAMVGLVQPFAKRYPLLDGQGNWGSIDGDNAAAFRYTEIRMDYIAREVLTDLEKDTVSFVPNYDESFEEPTVLPTKVPLLLVNGSNGIAVGMATSIPPHNLGEIIDACLALLKDPEISDRELFTLVPAPDFPGGGTICGLSGVAKAYKTGHGSVKLRGVVDVEEKQGRESLIIKEIPYQVNKAELIEKIADLVKNKVIDGITNIRDESSREGIRVVIEIRRGENARVILNQIYKHTSLESNISIILLAILNNRPVIFTLREMILQFLIHRQEVIRRRSQYELQKAQNKEHILQGIIIAISNIDEVIAQIKNSSTSDEATVKLQQKFELSLAQAKAILEMRLSKLTSLEVHKINQEILELLEEINKLKAILENDHLLKDVCANELIQIKQNYADKRRSTIDLSEETISDIDLVPNDEVVVTLTKKGYIKRAGMENYAVQHRGGKGKKGTANLDEFEDVIQDVFVGRNHDVLLFFTSRGRIYSSRVFELPEGSRTARGRAVVNILPLGEDERIIKLLGTSDLKDKYLVMVTKKGVIKKTESSAFEKIRSTGIIALDLREGDELAFCALSSGKDNILLSTSAGYGIRFSEEEIRPMGRQAAGVRGIKMKSSSDVIGLEVLSPDSEENQLLFATSKGFGKQVRVADFRLAHRGGMGVRTIPTGGRNGFVIGMTKVNEKSNILLVDEGGKIIVLTTDEIRTMGRAAKGVRLIRLDEDKNLTSVVAFDEPEEKNNNEVAPDQAEVIENHNENSNDDNSNLPE